MERWKPVVGFEGWYEVSDHGQVRRLQPGPGTQVGRILRNHPIPTGYLHVRLCVHSNPADLYVHRLVAEAFIGPRPRGLQINHINGNKTDNRPSNLEYVTQLQNMRHSFRPEFGRYVARGREHPRAKLSEIDVRAIVARRKEGGTMAAIAAVFHVSGTAIRDVMSGRTWSHVTGIRKRAS